MVGECVGLVDYHSLGYGVGYAQCRFLTLLEQKQVEILLHGLSTLDVDKLTFPCRDIAEARLRIPALAAELVQRNACRRYRTFQRRGHIGSHSVDLLVEGREHLVARLRALFKTDAFKNQRIIGFYCLGGRFGPERGGNQVETVGGVGYEVTRKFKHAHFGFGGNEALLECAFPGQEIFGFYFHIYNVVRLLVLLDVAFGIVQLL